MIGLIQHHLALSQVLSRDYVLADPRIDCEKNGVGFNTAKDEKFVFGGSYKLTEKMEDGAWRKSLNDKLDSLLGRELIAQTHPGLSCRLFLEMF